MSITRRHGPLLALAVGATVSFAAAPAAMATGTTEPPADTSGATTPDDDLTIGFVTHVVGNPFIQQIIDAAEFAAEDLGVAIEVTGPPGGDPDEQLTLAQGLVSSGVGWAGDVGAGRVDGQRPQRHRRLRRPGGAVQPAEHERQRPVRRRALEGVGPHPRRPGARAARRCRGDRPGHPRQLLPRLPGAREPGGRRAGGARRGPRAGGPRPLRRDRRPGLQLRRVGVVAGRQPGRRRPRSACARRTLRASARCRRPTRTPTSSPAVTTSPRTTSPRSRTASPTWRSARRRSCRATCPCTCSSTPCATAPSSTCRSSTPAPRSSPPIVSSSRSVCPS